MFTILVPLDGSKLAEAVLPHVENLAVRMHAEVFFMQSLDIPIRVVAAQSDALPGNVLTTTEVHLEQARKSAEEYLSGLAAAWQAKDIDASWEIVEGKASTRIIDAARTHKAAIIAMSTHGRSGLGQLVFGSVANEVLRESGIPVLLVRPKPGTFERT